MDLIYSGKATQTLAAGSVTAQLLLPIELLVVTSTRHIVSNKAQQGVWFTYRLPLKKCGARYHVSTSWCLESNSSLFPLAQVVSNGNVCQNHLKGMLLHRLPLLPHIGASHPNILRYSMNICITNSYMILLLPFPYLISCFLLPSLGFNT